MMELEGTEKNMEIVVQKNKVIMEENEVLKQELERLRGGDRLTKPDIKLEQLQSEMKEALAKQEEKKQDERDYGTTRQSRKYEADEDLDCLQDKLKASKAENERMLTLITRLPAEGKSRESVKKDALLLQNQLQAKILRYQEIRDSFHNLQASTENVRKEAALTAVSDDRMGEVNLLENQYKAQKQETENLCRHIASLKSDIEKLRTLLPDNISEVSVTICEQANVSEEMKNVCTQLIAAKEENKRLQDIMDNLRQGIETLQCKLTETSIENVNLTVQKHSSDNEGLKSQADNLSSRLTKFVADYPQQMPDTDTIRELTKEVRCPHEKLGVNIATYNIESIKEENIRLENLLKVRETEISTMRELLSANGIEVPKQMEVPVDVIKEPKETDEDTYEDTTTKKLSNHLVAENELLKKHLQRRTTYTPEIIIQLEEENELLKKQLSSETQIMESGRKETILPKSKPTEEIKAPQQVTIETKGVTDVTQQCRRASFAGKVTEKALRKEIDSLHKQLHDGNSNVRSLETALHELGKAKLSLQVTAPPKRRCGKCGKAKPKPGTETPIASTPAATQTVAETENERVMRNRTESLQRQLSDANGIVRSLQEATATAESENERNLHNIIEGLQSQLSDANNKAISVERTLDEVHNEYKLLQATGITEVAQQPPGPSTAEDNERSLRNQVESLQKQLSDANNIVITLERTLDELRDEYISMEVRDVTEVPRWSLGVPAAESENERLLRQQIESLQKQLTDAKGTVTRVTITAETEKEKMQQNQIEILQNQLTDASNTVRDLESTLDELRDEYESMQVPVVTNAPRQSRGKSVGESEILRNRIESLQKQCNEANNIVSTLKSEATTAETENERLLQNEIEILQNQLSDANITVRDLERTLDALRNEYESVTVPCTTETAQEIRPTSAAESENERLLRNQIESLEKQLADAKTTLTHETITAETEKEKMLQNKIERIQNQLTDADNTVRDLESTLAKLRDEYESMQVPGVSVRESEILRKRIESLQKQLNDANNIVSTLTSEATTAETENERLLQNEIVLLQNQLADANNMVRDLESTIDYMKKENESLQVSGVTKVPQVSDQKPTAVKDGGRNEIESLQKQLADANGMVKTLETTVADLRKQIESLQNKLNDSNAMVQELEDKVKKLTDENNVLKSKQIKDEVTQEAVPQDLGVSAPTTIDPEIEKVMKQLKTDNESLRNQLEEARKSVHKTSDDETKYEKIINELKTENKELQRKIEEIRSKQPRKSLEDPGTTKFINQMTQENELLKKQVGDLKMAQARPSSAGPSRDSAFEQLMKDNEALRERLENARKRIPVTSVPQEVIESEDIVKLRTDNEILRKELEDARKMAQSSQDQILVDDYTKIIDLLRNENEFLKKRLESLTDITSVSAKKVVTIVEKPVEIIKEDTDSEKTINELRNLNESLQNELKDAKTVIRSSKRKNSLNQRKLLQLMKNVDGDVSQLTEQNELLKKQLSDATKTTEDLTENIAKLKDEIQKLQSTKVPDVPSSTEEQSKELQKLEAELQELRDENNHLRRDNGRLKIELDTLTEDKVPSDFALWETEEKRLNSIVDKQMHRITTLIAKMRSKNDIPVDEDLHVTAHIM